MLFWQIFPAYVLLTVGLLLLLLLESKGKLRDFYYNQISANLAASAAMFGETANVALERGRYGEADALAKRLGKASGLRITVVLPTGQVVAESADDPALLESHRTRPEIATALDTRAMAHDVRDSATLQQDMLYVAVPLLRRGEPWIVVRVSTAATAVNDTLKAFERRMIYGALTAAVLIVIVSWLLARRISRPLEAITRGVERFGRGELGVPAAGGRIAGDRPVGRDHQRPGRAAPRANPGGRRAAQRGGSDLTEYGRGRAHAGQSGAAPEFQPGRRADVPTRCGKSLRPPDPRGVAQGRRAQLRRGGLVGTPAARKRDCYLRPGAAFPGGLRPAALCNASQQRIGLLAVFRDVTATRRT